MNISELLPVIKQVLINPYVIGTAVVVIFFMNFCSFVCNYKKKPPKVKPKKAPAPAAPAPAAPAPAAEGQQQKPEQNAEAGDTEK